MGASFGQKRQRAEGLRYPARPFFVWLDQSFGDKRGMKRGMGSVNASYSRTNQRNWPIFRIARRLCSIVLGVLIRDNNYLAQIFRLQPPRKRRFRSIYSEIYFTPRQGLAFGGAGTRARTSLLSL